MKNWLFGVVALVAVGCASAEADDENVGETQEDLSARSACKGKSAGDTCRLCGPNERGCVETMVLKTCQKRGSRLYCRAGSPAPQAYDGCKGKRAGDSCTLCDPSDRGCVETMDVKSCRLAGGKLTCGSGAPAYDPCAGKRTGASCTLCDPNDPDCNEIMVEKTCKANGQCTVGR